MRRAFLIDRRDDQLGVRARLVFGDDAVPIVFQPFDRQQLGRCADRLIDRDCKADALRTARTATFTPIIWPSIFTSGPPELPGLMQASVWIRSS